ncbi:TPA: alanine--glyoxylate aminotransferase family protein [Candidatus Geothermarchaeota archaeon]|nr:alanine--glyoxylate aminotransferase family protein [Candidatus Geothermarchaeota archaeon]
MRIEAGRHPILMIPGPSEPYPEALHIASLKIFEHYGSRWLKIYNVFYEYSLKLFGAESGYVIPFPIPASFTMEVILNSLFDKESNILFINDGFFVRRFKDIALRYGLSVHHVVPQSPGHRVDLDEVGLLMDAVDIEAVVVVHSETSQGILEDLDGISNIVKDRAVLIVDSVSSYGALKIDVIRRGIDICIGYSSKALGALNGITPVYISEEIADKLRERKKYKAFLNDLKVWYEYREIWPFHPYPTSLPTHVILSFIKAAENVLDEGLDKVERRHWDISRYVYRRLEEFGLEGYPEPSSRSPTVSVFKLNDVDADDIVDYLIKKYNILIGTSKFAGYNGIRIGHMGYTANYRFVEPVISGVIEYLSNSSEQ